MHTKIIENKANPGKAAEARSFIRSCVHCGFCNAVCPTYQNLGDEADGPRGRIYLIKDFLEGTAGADSVQRHLDRCLGCLACEKTCPSGVQYRSLLEIGREITSEAKTRSLWQRLLRRMMRFVLPHPGRFRFLIRPVQFLRPILPESLRRSVPRHRQEGSWPEPRHQRRMIVLGGCAQSVLAPHTNVQAAHLLDSFGISLLRVPGEVCCGALSEHMGAVDEARRFMKLNIDLWLSFIDDGVEALIMTASGCGATVRDYGRYMKDDPIYAAKAKIISDHTKDLSEIIAQEDLKDLHPASEFQKSKSKSKSKSDSDSNAPRVLVQNPCSYQHAQGLSGLVEKILKEGGYHIVYESAPGLCCGSAGSYSFLQPELSGEIRRTKIESLESAGADVIASINVGCIMHLEPWMDTPIRHLARREWRPVLPT